jgi:hypothetical protein
MMSNMLSKLGPGAVLACIALLTGCQNALSVRVELLAPKSEAAQTSAEVMLSQAAAQRYVREVVLTDGAMKAVQKRLDEASDALVQWNYPRADQPAQFPVLTDLEKELNPYRDSLQPHVNRATGAPSDKNEIMIEDVRELRGLQGRLAGLLALKTEPLARLESRLKGSAPDHGKEREKQTVDDAIQSLVKTVRAKSNVIGFGGFRIVGVHQMNPGDEIYRQVVDSKHYLPSGVYSAATAAANGDSTIVFVQEVPTYIRFFEIDNDPTQLIRNVMFIVDKVLQAAVKYAAF